MTSNNQGDLTLVERLEAAECGSRELDALVFVAAANDPNTYVIGPSPESIFSHVPGWYATGSDFSAAADPVTTSLDAALALAERVLPGWYWRAGNTPIGRWHHGRYTHGWAHLSRKDASNCDRGDEATGWAATAPLALCIAILKALNPEQSHGV